MSKLKYLRQTGDTIVEVLFALAIMGFVLAVAYSTANRSLVSARRAQERAEAIKFTETQIERIKAHANQGFNFPDDRIFCLDRDLNIRPIGTLVSFPAVTAPDTEPEADFPLYEAAGTQCHVDGTGQPSLYHYAIDYDTRINAGGQPEDFFTVLTRWHRAGGGGFDEITMHYKVHRP